MSLPEIVSREEWETARRELLAREKELTRARDELAAARRRLPMVLVDKDYRFEGPDGDVGLVDLFEGRHQLIVCHFMFDPAWEDGCPSCTAGADEMPEGKIAHLNARDTTLAYVSRAPYAKIARYKDKRGWTFPWYSSHGSDFNYDFHVTLDPAVAPVEYNYRDLDELGPDWHGWTGEMHGISAFLRRGGRIFHTYPSYARGTDMVNSTYQWLDLTARGRHEDWEQPPGRSDGPLLSWLRHHDRYGA